MHFIAPEYGILLFSANINNYTILSFSSAQEVISFSDSYILQLTTGDFFCFPGNFWFGFDLETVDKKTLCEMC